MLVIGVDEFLGKEDDFSQQAAQVARRSLQEEGDEVTPELDRDVGEALKGDGPALLLVQLTVTLSRLCQNYRAKREIIGRDRTLTGALTYCNFNTRDL